MATLNRRSAHPDRSQLPNHFTVAVENRRTFVIRVDGNTYQKCPSVLYCREADGPCH